MSTTSAPVLPMTVGQPTESTAQQTSSSSFAIRQFLSRLTEAIRRSVSNRRPWSELLDRTAFSRPDSISDAATRIRKNLSYFRTNYTNILAIILICTLLSHPFSLLLLLCLLAAWCFLYLFRPSDSSSPLVIMGRQVSERETLAGLLLCTIVVLFLTSVGSLVMSAVGIGSVVVCLHGAFRMPEDLFMDYEEVSGAGVAGMGSDSASRGFMSFLGGAASSVAAAAGGAQGRV